MQILSRRLEDLRIEALDDDEEREIAMTKAQFARQIVEIAGNSQIEKDLRLALYNAMQTEIGEIIEKWRKQRIVDAKNDADKVNADKIAEYNAQQVQEEIIQQQKLIDGKITREEFEQAMLDIELAYAIKRRDVYAGESKEYIDAQKRINDIILSQQQDLADKQLEIDQKSAEARRKVVEAGIDIADELLSISSQKRAAGLDAELSALTDRIGTVRGAIMNGNKEASKSLAQLEMEKEENAAAKEKLRKREIRDQQLIAGLRLLAANSDKPDAVGSTLKDVALLMTSLKSMGSFFDGTEDTGTAAKPLDSNGGRMAMLHDNERVMTAKQNAKLGGISNEELADLGAMHKSGELGGSSAMIVTQNNEKLISEVKEMTKAVKNIPIQSYNYDAHAKNHEQVIKTANKTEIHKQKANNLFK